jgi:flagellar FliL protein
MASKEKNEAEKTEEEEGEKGEEGAKEAAPKKAGLVGMVLGPVMALPRLLNPMAFLKLSLMMKLIVGGGTLAGFLVVGGAYYFLAGSAPAEGEEASAENVHTEGPRLPAEHAAFFDIPDIIVNIQSADAMPAYLKLAVSLELEGEEAKAHVEPVLPRVIDQFQSYLRELRVDDVRGSAGVMRLKEELLRRVNLAAAPTQVHDVLLKEMIIQ